MRTITEHVVNAANDRLALVVLDEPGAGGANHHYRVTGDPDSGVAVDIQFQNGPINEVGVNGLTHEVLLAIVADRLRAFQAGPFSCRENALALTKIEEAQHWLHSRTRARMARGVEGRHKV
ncbi:hypothetical protein [Nitratireductor sp. CH_MIT9313-5]|uniref:hypothetical protein n=1 Tax=Nitratireductor sp. CH_MIT9313-5 TaxID=3107764 RepID=UPI00300A53CB